MWRDGLMHTMAFEHGEPVTALIADKSANKKKSVVPKYNFGWMGSILIRQNFQLKPLSIT